MQRLVRFVHRIYIRWLEHELADAQLEYRVNTDAVKHLRKLQHQVQTDTQGTYPPKLVAELAATLERDEAILTRQATEIRQLQAEIKAERRKQAAS